MAKIGSHNKDCWSYLEYVPQGVLTDLPQDVPQVLKSVQRVQSALLVFDYCESQPPHLNTNTIATKFEDFRINSLGRILNIRLPSVRDSLSKGILLLRVSHWDGVIII